MKGRQTAMVLGAFVSALGTQALWADDNRAVPRGGGSSGGGHSSSGSSQPLERVRLVGLVGLVRQ